jgi:hypothetical protein
MSISMRESESTFPCPLMLEEMSGRPCSSTSTSIRRRQRYPRHHIPPRTTWYEHSEGGVARSPFMLVVVVYLAAPQHPKLPFQNLRHSGGYPSFVRDHNPLLMPHTPHGYMTVVRALVHLNGGRLPLDVFLPFGHKCE